MAAKWLRNVPSQWYNVGNNEYYGRGHGTRIKSIRDSFHLEMVAAARRAEIATDEARQLSSDATRERHLIENELHEKTDKIEQLELKYCIALYTIVI
ncbi:unnamed protein product [Protopolystoma xenopodis]|uniref:Uncharacterized protein n=1 Tax=Protopolystoma xenopodis TaxID=117903 RepID=A0A3S5C6G5_9PLAT|nr:unnamed protein product [Protopolystoma xenopodis]